MTRSELSAARVYFNSKYEFNLVHIEMFVSHRVGQCTGIASTLDFFKESNRSYDKYTFYIDTKPFTSKMDLWMTFWDSIKEVNRYVNLESEERFLTKELLNILG